VRIVLQFSNLGRINRRRKQEFCGSIMSCDGQGPGPQATIAHFGDEHGSVEVCDKLRQLLSLLGVRHGDGHGDSPQTESNETVDVACLGICKMLAKSIERFLATTACGPDLVASSRLGRKS
jgi:hypothetical protein